MFPGCTMQTSLAPNINNEALDVKVKNNQKQESLEQERVVEDSNQPEPIPQQQKTHVAPTPKPEPIIEPEIEPVIKPTQDVQQNCHPSYSGCLRADASDYDCAGGSGNGPYYTGIVKVIGPDVFDLDRDNDGWGCE